MDWSYCSKWTFLGVDDKLIAYFQPGNILFGIDM